MDGLSLGDKLGVVDGEVLGNALGIASGLETAESSCRRRDISPRRTASNFNLKSSECGESW